MDSQVSCLDNLKQIEKGQRVEFLGREEVDSRIEASDGSFVALGHSNHKFLLLQDVRLIDIEWRIVRKYINRALGIYEYWKEMVNPFTAQSGRGKSWNDVSEAHKTGLVIYESEGDPPIIYYIYGVGKSDNDFIQDKGIDFTLSNS